MKKTAKKAATSKPAKAPEPMDDSVREHAVGTAPTNRQRVCWAIKTLVDEVHGLFPETTVSYGDYDGRNTALGVLFDVAALSNDDAIDLYRLLSILGTDERVSDVVAGDEGARVLMRSNPRTQDNREPFGLADAYLILSGDEPDDEPGWVFEDDRQPPPFALSPLEGGSL